MRRSGPMQTIKVESRCGARLDKSANVFALSDAIPLNRNQSTATKEGGFRRRERIWMRRYVTHQLRRRVFGSNNVEEQRFSEFQVGAGRSTSRPADLANT